MIAVQGHRLFGTNSPRIGACRRTRGPRCGPLAERELKQQAQLTTTVQGSVKVAFGLLFPTAGRSVSVLASPAFRLWQLRRPLLPASLGLAENDNSI
jgi:hypothetical protein